MFTEYLSINAYDNEFNSFIWVTKGAAFHMLLILFLSFLLARALWLQCDRSNKNFIINYFLNIDGAQLSNWHYRRFGTISSISYSSACEYLNLQFALPPCSNTRHGNVRRGEVRSLEGHWSKFCFRWVFLPFQCMVVSTGRLLRGLLVIHLLLRGWSPGVPPPLCHVEADHLARDYLEILDLILNPPPQ